jgi:hypothetical protein
MTNALRLIRALDTPTPRERTQPLKSRRQRRQEERNRLKSSQANSQRKAG